MCADVLHTTRVVGVVYNNRQEIIARIKLNDYVILRPEPENIYDECAIGVWFKTDQIGYIPKEFAKAVAGRVRPETIGHVTKLTGGTERYPALGLEITFPVMAEAPVEVPND